MYAATVNRSPTVPVCCITSLKYVTIGCSCGPKSKAASDKEHSKEGDDKEAEAPKIEEAVWEAKLKFLQVTPV